MKISIGILAHNEAQLIHNILHSLSEQSLIQNLSNKYIVEVIVIPNGCQDNTAEIARKFLKNLASKLNSACFQWQVCEVTVAGKSNAWNLFVHQFSAFDADFFLFMDADIKLYAQNTLEKMLDKLVQNPEYWVSIDRPIKSLELKKNKNILERLSVAFSNSKSSPQGKPYICGQLYCGRVSIFRDIWMPAGLPVEDGFLTQMIIHENYTIKNPSFRRIARVMEASHIFEAYTNPLELINHEVRVVVGIVINIFLSNYFQEKCNEKRTAGALVAKMNQENHLWLNDFVKFVIAKRSRWIIPLSLVFRRYRSLKNYSIWKALLRIPIVSLAFLIDLNIFMQANSKLHREVITNYW